MHPDTLNEEQKDTGEFEYNRALDEMEWKNHGALDDQGVDYTKELRGSVNGKSNEEDGTNETVADDGVIEWLKTMKANPVDPVLRRLGLSRRIDVKCSAIDIISYLNSSSAASVHRRPATIDQQFTASSSGDVRQWSKTMTPVESREGNTTSKDSISDLCSRPINNETSHGSLLNSSRFNFALPGQIVHSNVTTPSKSRSFSVKTPCKTRCADVSISKENSCVDKASIRQKRNVKIASDTTSCKLTRSAKYPEVAMEKVAKIYPQTRSETSSICSSLFWRPYSTGVDPLNNAVTAIHYPDNRSQHAVRTHRVDMNVCGSSARVVDAESRRSMDSKSILKIKISQAEKQNPSKISQGLLHKIGYLHYLLLLGSIQHASTDF